MSCEPINTLEGAMETIPSSVLPINGLRRDGEGNLTLDALTMVVDGLKSRGINPMDETTNKKIRQDLGIFLCKLNNQYQFLLKELLVKLQNNEDVKKEFLYTIKEKNKTMQDVINTSGYLQGILAYNPSKVFIEGWQNTDSTMTSENHPTIAKLQAEMNSLDSKSYLELRKHMIDMTEQKNRMASNNLGLYGFLNLVAIGLLIYVATAHQVKNN
jgi:ribosomal protein S8